MSKATIPEATWAEFHENIRGKLVELLAQDLDFHGEITNYASHNFHSFPAKFPPQIPRTFIYALTKPGEVVLDPMMGSGTTIVEAFLAGRQAIGIDIDPLALLITKVKVTQAEKEHLSLLYNQIYDQAKIALSQEHQRLEQALSERWDSKTKQFVDNWFAPQTQLELLALVEEIEKIPEQSSRDFFTLAFSSIIITKSGGVSLALDLGHTRPHKAKMVTDRDGKTVLGENIGISPSNGNHVLYKTIGSPLEEFRRRVHRNLSGLPEIKEGMLGPHLAFGNAQCLNVSDSSVNLIVTSPPYASNAIDYMRAHKFSLVWFGHSIESLSEKRREYIGGEVVAQSVLEQLPRAAARIVEQIASLDPRKGRVLHLYYSEMVRALREMHRVLKPGSVAVVVVGTSLMRSIDTDIANCLAEIGVTVGFEVPKIGVRSLDRDRRMMPVGNNLNRDSQIQQRIHEEYVIGFLKPKCQRTSGV